MDDLANISLRSLFLMRSQASAPINPLGVNIDLMRANLSVSAEENNQQQSSSNSESENNEEDEEQCSICLDDVHKVSRVKPCKHKFCQSCLLEWLFQKFYCPMCRQRMTLVDFRYRHPNRHRLRIGSDLLNNVITKLLENSPEFFHMLAHHVLDKLHSNPDQSFKIDGIPNGLVFYLTYDVVARALFNSCSQNQIIQFFRYIVYRECLTMEIGIRGARCTSINFYRQRPAMTHRLMAFFYRETIHFLNSIAFPKVIEANNPQANISLFSARAKDLLHQYDISSKEFRKSLYELFHRFYPKYLVSPRMVAKYQDELVAFAESNITDFDAYLGCARYIFPDKVIEEVTLESTDPNDSDIQFVTVETKSKETGVNNKRKSETPEEEPVPGPSGISNVKKRKANHDHDCEVIHLVASGSNSSDDSSGGESTANETRFAALLPSPPSPIFYKKNEVREMRRIIRLAYRSPYYYQKLMIEIKKMSYNFNSILNSAHFAHLSDYFKSVLHSASLYNNRTLNCDTPKRPLTLAEIDKRLNQRSDRLPVGGTGQPSSEDDDHHQARDVDTALNLTNYELSHRRQLNQEVIDYVKSPLQRPHLPNPTFIQYRSPQEQNESDW